MTHRVESGWLYAPSQRKKNPDIEYNTFVVWLTGIENEDDLSERVKRKLKRRFEQVLKEEGIECF